MRLLILGASGGCGQWITRLAIERGHDVRALVRPTTRFDPPDGVEVARGLVLEDGTLERVMEGRDVVISALGIKRKNPLNPWSPLASPPDLMKRVAENLARVASEAGVSRVLAISAAGVRDSIEDVHPMIRWMICNSNVNAAYLDLAAMERAFSESDLDWMALRPTTLTPGRPSGSTIGIQRYGLLTTTRRSDVAEFLLDVAASRTPLQDRTPMIASR
ncbi:NAD(P)-dependent oxidoreductase [Rubrivirga sp.]|uniref:NAD(P)-dependent oxidoreductase n=1 Tax=Rubrivirga sp. TaxID=1885344 RepID=UPI003C75A6F6